MEYINYIADELVCGICQELCRAPVRFKVYEKDKVIICNEVFCQPCAIIYLYNIQKNGSNIKCPVCNRKIYVDDKHFHILDAFIEDKLIKNIIDRIYVLIEKQEYSCIYECGFVGNRENLYEHYTAENQCDRKIIKCGDKCGFLGYIGEEMYEHKNICPVGKYKCPFCPGEIFKKKEEFIKHIEEYHKIGDY